MSEQYTNCVECKYYFPVYGGLCEAHRNNYAKDVREIKFNNAYTCPSYRPKFNLFKPSTW